MILADLYLYLIADDPFNAPAVLKCDSIALNPKSVSRYQRKIVSDT